MSRRYNQENIHVSNRKPHYCMIWVSTNDFNDHETPPLDHQLLPSTANVFM